MQSLSSCSRRRSAYLPPCYAVTYLPSLCSSVVTLRRRHATSSRYLLWSSSLRHFAVVVVLRSSCGSRRPAVVSPLHRPAHLPVRPYRRPARCIVASLYCHRPAHLPAIRPYRRHCIVASRFFLKTRGRHLAVLSPCSSAIRSSCLSSHHQLHCLQPAAPSPYVAVALPSPSPCLSAALLSGQLLPAVTSYGRRLAIKCRRFSPHIP